MFIDSEKYIYILTSSFRFFLSHIPQKCWSLDLLNIKKKIAFISKNICFVTSTH